jgi:septum formation protein
MQEAVYLASGSPRRRELLAQIGVRTEVIAVNVDETRQLREAAETYVSRLALAKARAGWQAVAERAQGRPVLGADTIVVCERDILGKPRDRHEAAAMLQRLSARTHKVLTAVALVKGERTATALSITDVSFKALTADEIQRYCATGEPDDKAGAYGIQGYGAAFVTHIHGSYSGVVGLPLAETAQLLIRSGVPIWQC